MCEIVALPLPPNTRRSLYRSYPTTVLMNIPYAAVVVSTNETLKKVFQADTALPNHPMAVYVVVVGACIANLPLPPTPGAPSRIRARAAFVAWWLLSVAAAGICCAGRHRVRQLQPSRTPWTS
jgi:hypothetical protein